MASKSKAVTGRQGCNSKPKTQLELRLELENVKLREENEKLDKIVEIICKQNSQYADILEQHKEYEKEIICELEQAKCSIKDAVDKQVEMKNDMQQILEALNDTISKQDNNQAKLRNFKKALSIDLEESWHYTNLGCGTVERALEDIKDRIIHNESDEIMIGMDFF
jgi:CRISPR/Cas system CSM-associated protein Csm2 small subunit